MKLAAGIAAAGALGAIARYCTGIAMQSVEPPGFPWATLSVNLAGCLLLGWFTGYVSNRTVSVFWKETIATGFIGSFTTFSAFSVEMLEMTQTGHGLAAGVYAAASIIAGCLLAWWGVTLGRRSRG